MILCFLLFCVKPCCTDSILFFPAAVTKLPVADVEGFAASARLCYRPGVTLLVDFPFPAAPDNLGHLAETLLPTFR